MNHHEHVYSVSALNAESAALLADHFGLVSVIGEISNLSRPSSGHLYFSLKDASAQIRCALFRFQHQQIQFAMENGQEVIVLAKVSLYEPRGDFQLIVTHVQLAGSGQLQIAFEKLKNELEKKGLFDDKNKKKPPSIPQHIGIITSPTGAALQDILNVLKKRFPAIPVTVYPTAVQGHLAAGQLVDAIEKANQHAICDVLILARGGGSIEDLWPFNEASVAQAIFKSAIPIITGIGHQTDFTIADFVADYRAPTPSAAAEHATPDCAEFVEQLQHYYARFMQLVSAKLKQDQTQLLHLEKRLKHPGEKIQMQAQQLDQLEIQLHRLMQYSLLQKKERMAHCAHILETLSPLKTVQRGFSITRNKETGAIVLHRADVKKGMILSTKLTDGEVESIVF